MSFETLRENMGFALVLLQGWITKDSRSRAGQRGGREISPGRSAEVVAALPHGARSVICAFCQLLSIA